MNDIEVRIDDDMLERIERVLGDLKRKAPRALATSTNKTAREAKKMLLDGVKKRYTLDRGKIKEGVNIKNATAGYPSAKIKFKTRRRLTERFSYKVAKAGVRTKVLKSGGYMLAGAPKRRAFIAGLNGGSTRAIMAREPTSKGHKDKIHVYHTISVSEMVGSDKTKILEGAEPKIKTMLDKHVEAQIAKIIARG